MINNHKEVDLGITRIREGTFLAHLNTRMPARWSCLHTATLNRDYYWKCLTTRIWEMVCKGRFLVLGLTINQFVLFDDVY